MLQLSKKVLIPTSAPRHRTCWEPGLRAAQGQEWSGGRSRSGGDGEAGAAREHNERFPEQGQRVQRHKRSYSAAGLAPQPAQGWGEEQGEGKRVLHISVTVAGAQICPMAPPKPTEATGSGLGTMPLSTPSRPEAGRGLLAKRAKGLVPGSRV